MQVVRISDRDPDEAVPCLTAWPSLESATHDDAVQVHAASFVPEELDCPASGIPHHSNPSLKGSL